MKLKYIESIPSSNDPEFDKAIRLLLNPPVSLSQKNYYYLQLASCLGIWTIAFHWLYKKQWDKTYIIPISQKAKLVEPFGEMLYQLLRLCKHCYNTELSHLYKNSTEWFYYVASDILTGDMELLLNPKTEKNQGKKSFIRDQRSILKGLKEHKNRCNISTHFHLALLIKTSLLHVEKSEPFNQNYWEPFLSAIARHIKSFDRNNLFKQCVIEDEMFKIRTGQGRGKIAVPNITVKLYNGKLIP